MATDEQSGCPDGRPPLSKRQLDIIELDRVGYDAIASAQSALLDKSIISIAGASFSLSIGFIDKLIPLDKAVAHWMLWVSMLILAISIIVTVLSFWAGENCARFRRELCDKAENECDTDILYNSNPWVTPLIWFNRSRLLFFVFGIALLAGFIFYNGITQITPASYVQEQGVDHDSTPITQAPATTVQPSADAQTSATVQTIDTRTRRSNVTTTTTAGASETTEEVKNKSLE